MLIDPSISSVKTMIDEARQYLANRNIARREPLYSANRFARHMGDITADQVTTEHLNELRVRLLATKLATSTIESTIADVITVVTAVTGSMPQKGRKLIAPKVRPRPASTESIDAIWPHCSPSLRAFIALAYWSALRQSDAMTWLQWHKNRDVPPLIEHRASKTGKLHEIPMPSWLPPIVSEGRYRFRSVSDYARKSIRREIAAACTAAGVTRWGPKNLRQASVTAWSQANAIAGRIIHGCGLGIMDHYIDPMSVLTSAMDRVRVPAAFGAASSPEESFLTSYRRLDPSAQNLIGSMAERLAAG